MSATEESHVNGTVEGQPPRSDAPPAAGACKVKQTRDYIVHGPSATPYFTLRPAAEAAAVPPLPRGPVTSTPSPPSARALRGRGRGAAQAAASPSPCRLSPLNASPRGPASPTSTVWRPSCAALRHRWRFIRKEEFGLVRPPRVTGAMVPKHVLDSEHSAVGRVVEECSLAPGDLPGNRGAPQPLETCQPDERPSQRHPGLRKRGVRRGWLEKALQDEDGAGDASHSSEATALPPSTAAGSGLAVGDSAGVGRALPAKGEGGRAVASPGRHARILSPRPEPEAAAPATTSSTAAATVAEAGARSPRRPSPTAAHAAQRLRDTLLSASFQRMVDDLGDANAYGPVDRVALLRHANIFRELPLQSRYQEMHPLYELRPAGQDFLQVKSPKAAAREVNSPFPLLKRPSSGEEAMTAVVDEGMASAATEDVASL
ncbi:uncharacterized protein Tco025E_04873 [Trypanosoma conorhini]|uniref:Uncharacterized protein n=1 Tax=Trypanosoma conorhini TaxID=83891 RepID=A0A422PI60_9TRYP|nr:uncharacterized protein Tco025E_04873 [Trypanosoma conorhini]RNF17418.1 hypothetical protein Tco025E_04873 [Trypanosoma conorhini]